MESLKIAENEIFIRILSQRKGHKENLFVNHLVHLEYKSTIYHSCLSQPHHHPAAT